MKGHFIFSDAFSLPTQPPTNLPVVVVHEVKCPRLNSFALSLDCYFFSSCTTIALLFESSNRLVEIRSLKSLVALLLQPTTTMQFQFAIVALMGVIVPLVGATVRHYLAQNQPFGFIVPEQSFIISNWYITSQTNVAHFIFQYLSTDHSQLSRKIWWISKH